MEHQERPMVSFPLTARSLSNKLGSNNEEHSHIQAQEEPYVANSDLKSKLNFLFSQNHVAFSGHLNRRTTLSWATNCCQIFGE